MNSQHIERIVRMWAIDQPGTDTRSSMSQDVVVRFFSMLVLSTRPDGAPPLTAPASGARRRRLRPRPRPTPPLRSQQGETSTSASTSAHPSANPPAPSSPVVAPAGGTAAVAVPPPARGGAPDGAEVVRGGAEVARGGPPDGGGTAALGAEVAALAARRQVRIVETPSQPAVHATVHAPPAKISAGAAPGERRGVNGGRAVGVGCEFTAIARAARGGSTADGEAGGIDAAPGLSPSRLLRTETATRAAGRGGKAVSLPPLGATAGAPPPPSPPPAGAASEAASAREADEKGTRGVARSLGGGKEAAEGDEASDYVEAEDAERAVEEVEEEALGLRPPNPVLTSLQLAATLLAESAYFSRDRVLSDRLVSASTLLQVPHTPARPVHTPARPVHTSRCFTPLHAPFTPRAHSLTAPSQPPHSPSHSRLLWRPPPTQHIASGLVEGAVRAADEKEEINRSFNPWRTGVDPVEPRMARDFFVRMSLPIAAENELKVYVSNPFVYSHLQVRGARRTAHGAWARPWPWAVGRPWGGARRTSSHSAL